MTPLPDADRGRIATGLQRYWSRLWEGTPFLGADIRAAINVTDDWIDAKQAEYNAALPLPFRTSATLVQKTIMFCAVALMRVSISFLKQIFGEVN